MQFSKSNTQFLVANTPLRFVDRRFQLIQAWSLCVLAPLQKYVTKQHKSEIIALITIINHH